MLDRMAILEKVARMRRETRQPMILDLCDLVEALLKERHRGPPVYGEMYQRPVRDPDERRKRSGRPPTGKALSNAERQRRWREKRRGLWRAAGLIQAGPGTPPQ
jgi:hypothetical protein